MNNKTKRNLRGFTLVELMVVIVIIGILAGTVGLKVLGNIDKAKRNKTLAQVKIFHKAVISFKMDTNYFPESLDELVEDPGDLEGWQKGGYLDDTVIPLDEWDNEYIYEVDGADFFIWSLGADGEDGGEDINADIYNVTVSDGE